MEKEIKREYGEREWRSGEGLTRERKEKPIVIRGEMW